jgi:hypothetical protein
MESNMCSNHDTRDIQYEAMQKILDGMKNDGLGDIISLSPETFIALPSAFNTKGILILTYSNINNDTTLILW